MGKPSVVLRRCAEYDPDMISRIIQDGLDAFGLVPRIKGRVTIKPSVDFAHPKVSPSAYTRPEFVDGLTAPIKLNIGIMCDRRRMWNHNTHLDEKVADMLEVGRPDQIVTDSYFFLFLSGLRRIVEERP